MGILQEFLFQEPTIIVTIMTILTLISTIYLGLAEFFGNHLQYSKFWDARSRSSGKKQGIKLSSRTGMLFFYTPAFLAGVVSFFVLPDAGTRFFLLKLALTTHFFKRVLEVLFVHKYSGGIILDSAIIISAFYFTAAASMIYVQYASLGLPEPSIDLKYIGLVMYLVGIIGNLYHHIILSKLRAKGERGYKIPKGGLFDLVVCPHYLFEILVFVGIAFISQTPLSFAAMIGDTFYLFGRSYNTRNWYASKFEDFPKNVKALIPYVF